MTNLHLRYQPNVSQAKIEENLFLLLVSGEIRNRRLEKHVARLAERFRVYASTYPLGLWAPGLAITGEMRAVTELYLPMAELKSAFDLFFSLSLKYSPLPFSPIHTSTTWLDALQQVQPFINRSDPAALLQQLMTDESFRIKFFFTLFLPKRHGGNFGRYPEQTTFLQKWLGKHRRRPYKGLRCLDAACGTGETTYELALLLLKNGFPAGSFEVHGSTIEPLELFAAAHTFFPHEPKRQEDFRKKAEPVFTAGADKRILFFTEDISRSFDEERKEYDIILCNGLLGGPKFHTVTDLEGAASALASRLSKGGILLAADRFHDGWKKCVPASLLQGIFTEFGFHVRDIGDGLAAEKG